MSWLPFVFVIHLKIWCNPHNASHTLRRGISAFFRSELKRVKTVESIIFQSYANLNSIKRVMRCHDNVKHTQKCEVYDKRTNEQWPNGIMQNSMVSVKVYILQQQQHLPNKVQPFSHFVNYSWCISWENCTTFIWKFMESSTRTITKLRHLSFRTKFRVFQVNLIY